MDVMPPPPPPPNARRVKGLAIRSQNSDLSAPSAAAAAADAADTPGPCRRKLVGVIGLALGRERTGSRRRIASWPAAPRAFDDGVEHGARAEPPSTGRTRPGRIERAEVALGTPRSGAVQTGSPGAGPTPPTGNGPRAGRHRRPGGRGEVPAPTTGLAARGIGGGRIETGRRGLLGDRRARCQQDRGGSGSSRRSQSSARGRPGSAPGERPSREPRRRPPGRTGFSHTGSRESHCSRIPLRSRIGACRHPSARRPGRRRGRRWQRQRDALGPRATI